MKIDRKLHKLHKFQLILNNQFWNINKIVLFYCSASISLSYLIAQLFEIIDEIICFYQINKLKSIILKQYMAFAKAKALCDMFTYLLAHTGWALVMQQGALVIIYWHETVFAIIFRVNCRTATIESQKFAICGHNEIGCRRLWLQSTFICLLGYATWIIAIAHAEQFKWSHFIGNLNSLGRFDFMIFGNYFYLYFCKFGNNWGHLICLKLK